ncbi:MAG: YdeI/OmpD-associated family protein [Steroidobacteraceae bacterium]
MGYTYRSTMAVMGGKYMVGVSADVRAAAKVAGGDSITVSVELDSAPRDVTVPVELQRALAHNAKARALFESLSYSKKRLYTLPIERGKTDETRQRNLAKAMDDLAQRAC